MNIGHVVYGYFPFDPRVRREVDALREAGYVLHVIALRGPEEGALEVREGVRIYRVPLAAKRGGRLRYVYQYALFFILSTVLLMRIHRRDRLAVIHVHSLPDFQVFCALPLRPFGAKVVLDLHEAFPEILAARFGLRLTSPLVIIARVVERLSMAAADHVLTVNETLRDLFVRRGVPAGKVTVVMNSPDERVLRAGNPEALRKNLGLSESRALVYIGGLNPERDLSTLLRAVAILRPRWPYRLVVGGYGSPEYLESLRRLTADLGLDDSVRFLPPVPHNEVLRYLAISDLGVVPYEDNPLTQLAVPTKVFEYAAAGKAMVIADLGALRSLFDGTAEFYRPGSPDDLAGAIERLASDPGRAEILAARSREVLERCSWPRMRARLLDVYSRLAGGAG